MTPLQTVLGAYQAACARVDLAGRVATALTNERGPLVVIAAGKCARAMLQGALAARERDIVRALVVVPSGSAWQPGRDEEVLEAAHPLPDETSVRAADAALALAASPVAAERLFLISGGASSLLCAPAPGLSLERKRAVTLALLRADVSIADVNVVRRHLSRIKGGGLARACGSRSWRTLIVSDVLEGGAPDVGSGPSVSDPTTIADAMEVASSLSLGDLPWVETWKGDERHDFIASPRMFADLVASAFRERGLSASPFVDKIGGDLETLARRYAMIASNMATGDVLVQAAEPSLRVPANAGRGGRCSYLAALMSTRLPERTLFAAIATDGVDGSSGTAGAIVQGPIEGARAAIERFDTGPLHITAGTALPESPTGLNFADLHILLRY